MIWIASSSVHEDHTGCVVTIKTSNPLVLYLFTESAVNKKQVSTLTSSEALVVYDTVLLAGGEDGEGKFLHSAYHVGDHILFLVLAAKLKGIISL